MKHLITRNLPSQSHLSSNNSFINLKSLNENTFKPNDTIIFDESTISSSNIEYISSTGDILFNENGIYLVSFWISFVPNPVNPDDPPIFSLQLFDQSCCLKASADVIATIGPNNRISVKGNQLITISAGNILTLKNKSFSPIRLFSENGFSGELVITKLASSNSLLKSCISPATSLDEFNSFISVENRSDIKNITVGEHLNLSSILFASNISYSSGIFTIMEQGIYLVNWKINCGQLDSSSLNDNSAFVLSLVKDGVQILTSGQQTSNILETTILECIGIVSLNTGDEISIINTGNLSFDVVDFSQDISATIGIVRIA